MVQRLRTGLPVSMPFSIVTLQTGLTRIALEGDLDAFTSGRLRPELEGVARRRPDSVEVDLSLLRSINAPGAEILASFLRGMAREGCPTTVKGLGNQCLGRFSGDLPSADERIRDAVARRSSTC